ncbi:excisionase family DNA binding protein [Pedobacter cryoconitis]|uniref:helix-turn-helix domain-containing protein n=1 Tax=Pedobacter cryoconitis TaxID=188932 RepID=UPI00161265B1|nr:helix-turn-helix domain-containing protein [Pedobacter cryoconitis]MBB6271900.1 excisionase family DNA binding protein [Pedobacter cryoconitis]
MNQPTFEQLPAMVSLLLEKVESLERTLMGLHSLNSSEELLTVDQTAEFLKLSVPTLYSKVSRGEIPVSKPGKRLYFKKSELLKWVTEGRKSTFNELNHASSNFIVPGRLRCIRRIKK